MLLTIVVDHLCNELEHSGDKNNFSVRSDRHDSITIRLIVPKKLTGAKVPVELFHPVHQEIMQARVNLETKVR